MSSFNVCSLLGFSKPFVRSLALSLFFDLIEGHVSFFLSNCFGKKYFSTVLSEYLPLHIQYTSKSTEWVLGIMILRIKIKKSGKLGKIDDRRR